MFIYYLYSTFYIPFFTHLMFFSCKIHHDSAILLANCWLGDCLLIIYIRQKLMPLPARLYSCWKSLEIAISFKKSSIRSCYPSSQNFTLRFTNFFAACTFFNTLPSFFLTLSSLLVLIRTPPRGVVGYPGTSKKGSKAGRQRPNHDSISWRKL